MLTYLLPILIAGQGGKMIAGDRGRVIAAIAVVGCICGSDYTMLMGAMVMGPLAGWVIKQFDKKVEGHIPAGFEMLINNFSIGILGMLLAILGYYVIGPFMTAILTVLTAGVDFLVAHSLLPLVSIFIEPAKVLFLNNAINHGIFSPIGASQAAETGRSIMYMLEANPGPGLGVLLAYCFFCKDDTTRQSAPGAVIIHLLGGIHEIYFPYILMNPVIIIAPHRGQLLCHPVLLYDRCRSVRSCFSRFHHRLHGNGSPGFHSHRSAWRCHRRCCFLCSVLGHSESDLRSHQEPDRRPERNEGDEGTG